MQTNIQVANNALYDINANPIMDFNDPTKEARVVNSKFQSVLDEVMTVNQWNCNRQFALLNYTEEPELYGWKYAFVIPNDCLFVRAVVPFNDISQLTPETMRRFTEFSMNQRSTDLYMLRGIDTVFANHSNILLIYSQSIKDCSILPAYIAKLVEKCLTAEIAYPITQDRTLAADKLNVYQQKLMLAKALNAREENVFTPISSFITSRGD